MNIKRFTLFLILILFSCQSNQLIKSAQDQTELEHIKILYTNDEHGWMEASADHGGAAALMNTWVEDEECEIDTPCLILSGGDMWSGPAISTIAEGESMVEVMNTMGYDAAALGNHEFDFGLDNLEERITEMNFPILAANLKYKVNGQRPDFVKPYLITEIGNVSVGIIGLALIETPMMTKLENVISFEFTDYVEALKEIAPLVKSDGAELIIVIGHVCKEEMLELVPIASELGIPVIGGGHCHKLYADQVNDVVLIQSGSNFRNYVKVDILFNDDADTVTQITPSIHANDSKGENTIISEIVSNWRTELDRSFSEVIGYANEVITEDSIEMENMITDSWLISYPQADIALTNAGGIRQSIPQGDITIETIYGLLPFSNNILALDLTGKEIRESLSNSTSIVMAGLSSVEGYKLSNGEFLHEDSTYNVLINDFMYTHPYSKYNIYDENPYDTGINYRQPLVDWLKSLNTSKENPINNYLDSQPR